MDKNNHIQQLINSRKLSTNEEYELFEGALQALHMSISIDDIADICKAFCDDTKDDEVMFGIIHLIEQLQGEEYLKTIAICTPDMKDAHDWAMTLNKRIINSQKYFEKYIEIIGELEKDYKEKILNPFSKSINDSSLNQTLSIEQRSFWPSTISGSSRRPTSVARGSCPAFHSSRY